MRSGLILEGDWDFENFDREEFECPDCAQAAMKWRFMSLLQKSRTIAKVPFSISSGYRCPNHNARVNGHPRSPHLIGMAADIRVRSNEERFHVIGGLMLAGFKIIGMYVKHAHVALDPERPAPCMFLGEE